MEAECFENIVSVPAGVRLEIVLCHRYQSLLDGQPAARGASGTVPLSSMSTGRVVDIVSSLAHFARPNGRLPYLSPERLSSEARGHRETGLLEALRT